MSMTEIDPATGQSIPSPRRNGSGASSPPSARGENPSLGESLDGAKSELKAKAQEARANLKAKAEEARTAASERLSQAKTKATEIAATAQQKATEGGKAAVAQVRAHPVRSALIAGAAAGVAVGVVMAMRQSHSRKLAARTAKSFWRDYGKILLPLATALAVPAKAAGDAAPGLMAKGAKIAKAMPDRLSRALH